MARRARLKVHRARAHPSTRDESALVVLVPEAEALVLRDRGAGAAKEGNLPAHVTLLYPFLRPTLLDDGEAARIAAALLPFPPFRFCLSALRTFPGVDYLAPEPSAPFVAITDALVRQFPRCLPYGGLYKDVVPHLTVASGTPLSVEQQDRIRSHLPLASTASAVTLLSHRPGEDWIPMKTFLLEDPGRL